MPATEERGGRCCSPSDADRAEDSPMERDSSEFGMKLLCDFWQILQDDPDCNLSEEVQQRMCVDNCSGKCRLSGAADSKPNSRLSSPTASRAKTIYVPITPSQPKGPKKHRCGASSETGVAPLRKALGNLKKAASFEKKCTATAAVLVSTQQTLVDKIKYLEENEKKGVGLLRQADCMWTCMEGSYKEKVAESQKRYEMLQKQLKQVEESANKWRKNKKDLEFQIKNLNKCDEEIKEKTIQKENDVKIMTLQIEGFKKRIESNKKDMVAANKSFKSKKELSDARMAKIGEQITKFKDKICYECNCKTAKEEEGSNYVKEAREDLQKLCRCLLQKKLENEDLRAEKEALLVEIGLLKNTCNTCTERCRNREKNLSEELNRVDKEIANFKAKCTKCHKQTDSSEIMAFCADCPRCSKQKECLNEGDHCVTDKTKVCVCTRIKEKFLDNVFENMYNVLERQVKTCPGKEMADCILNCLKRSRNGKLDQETRKILQDFILSTVRKNLNLTIVGGAVKTRCEMDPETYKQLMLCLKDVSVTRPEKKDKGTTAKKPPCNRWSGIGECNCPRGPSGCLCVTKAPKPPKYLTSCGTSDTEEVDPSVKVCPQPEPDATDIDCSMIGLPGAAVCKRDPCGGQTCPFTSNMRAAQCVLGPEVLADVLAQTTRPMPLLPSEEKAKYFSGVKTVISYHADFKNLKTDSDINETKSDLEPKLLLPDATSELPLLKPISSLQRAVLFSDQGQDKVFEDIIQRNLNQNENKKQFKIAFENDNGQSNYQFGELVDTASGKLAIELDQQTVQIIEEKSKTNPNMFISVKTSASGSVSVNLNTKENIIDKTHRVTVRKTSSGTNLLDIHKNIIRKLKNALSNNMPNDVLSDNTKLPSSSKSSYSPIEVNNLNLQTHLKKNENNNNKEIEKTILQQENRNINNANTTLESIFFKVKNLSDTFLKGISTTVADPDLPLNGTVRPTTILTEINMPLMDKKSKNTKDSNTTPNSSRCNLLTNTEILKDIKEVTISKSLNSDPCNLMTDFNDSQEKPSTSRSVDPSNYRSEFNQLYKQSNGSIIIDIKGENGVVCKLPSVVTKTKSGTIAIHVESMTLSKEISFHGNECPVLLYKTVSGTYFVKLSNNEQNYNATLIKTPSKGMLLIPKTVEEMHRIGQQVTDLFKVKLFVMRNEPLELPAVLKKSQSNNYVVVLDKEFETSYKETVKEYFGDNFEGSVDLHTTMSGNYILELDSKDESSFGKKNALLVKTLSGNIKVLVNGPEFESTVQHKLSPVSLAQVSSKTDNKLPASSHTKNPRESKNLDNVASSDTQSFGKVRVKLRDTLRLHSEPSAVLKKTSSGQYAVVLNKESKKSFINNLQSNSDGFVTISQSDSKEIITGPNKDKAEDCYGTLKVTPSGNIFVTVDKKVIKDVTESTTKNELSGATSTRSSHVTQLLDSVHKAVAITCQGKSGESCSDPSTCVCTELSNFNTTDGSSDLLVQQLCPCSRDEASADKANTIGGVHIPSTSRDKSVQKSKNKSKYSDQCYYLIGSNYPRLSFDGVPIEVLKSSDSSQENKKQCKKRVKSKVNKKQPKGRNAQQDWDSISYLPPQLPYFLKEVSYRY